MIFIDSNIPMYLIGQSHPNKVDAQRMLEDSVAREERLVTSVEVFQEILHRYVAIGRREAIHPAFEVLREVVDEVFPIELPHVERAKEIVSAYTSLSARDALHLAIMEANGVDQIMSFDKGFDAFPGVRRLSR